MADRILIIGVSSYLRPHEFGPLPGVANDVQEMAALLSFEKGNFAAPAMTVLVDRSATHSAVTDAIRSSLSQADESDVVLIYLAGHGALDATDAYFAVYDTDGCDLVGTALKLSELREEFQRTRSRRVVMMLDSCHSGGVIARSAQAAVERAVKIVAGEGRIVMAACTAVQFSYESPTTGHGNFTNAVLKGLKGDAADKRGEVTITGLFDFVDHSMGGPSQRPMLAGTLTGRMVIAYTQPRSAPSGQPTAARADEPAIVGDSTPWLMLDDRFFRSLRAVESSSGVSIECEALNPADDIFLRQQTQGRGSRSLAFAHGNTAGNATIQAIRSETSADGARSWHLELSIESARSGITEMGTTGYNAREIAELRAQRLLIGKPEYDEHRMRAHDSLEMLIAGFGPRKVKGSLLADLSQSLGNEPDFLKKARLSAIYWLQAVGCVDDTTVLELQPTGDHELVVRFAGARRHGGFSEGGTIQVRGRVKLDRGSIQES